MERILATDDDTTTLSLIQSILTERGYDVAVSNRGRKTLEEIKAGTPDLLIVDLNMPEMSGIELIQNLRNIDECQTIPILVLTALKSDAKLVEALDAGADDFLGKPFSPSELVARVRTHLRVGQRFQTLGLKMRELKELKQMRDDLTHMIVHDMKNPLAAIHGNLDLIALNGLQDKARLDRLMRNLKYSCTMLSDLVANILDLESAEQKGFALDKQPVNLPALIEDVLQEQRAYPYTSNIHLTFTFPDSLLTVEADRTLIRRVLSNLVNNAVKHSPPEKTVSIAIENVGRSVQVCVSDEGPGVPVEFHQKIFEKFGTLRARKEGILGSTGLGLAFCKLAVEAHGGTIGMTSVPGKGSTFHFSLPLRD